MLITPIKVVITVFILSPTTLHTWRVGQQKGFGIGFRVRDGLGVWGLEFRVWGAD